MVDVVVLDTPYYSTGVVAYFQKRRRKVIEFFVSLS
jgi:hypothetical protein